MNPNVVIGERPYLLAEISEFILFLILGHGMSWDSDGIILLLYRIMRVLRRCLVSPKYRRIIDKIYAFQSNGSEDCWIPPIHRGRAKVYAHRVTSRCH